MNNNIIARVKAAENDCKINKKPEPTIRLTYNDNSVKVVGVMEALNAMTLDYNMQPPSLHPINAEVVCGYERAPKLCDTVIQLCGGELSRTSDINKQEVNK